MCSEFIIPWDSFTGQVASFDTKGILSLTANKTYHYIVVISKEQTNFSSFFLCAGNVSGRVKIVVGDGLKVWHTGLLLNIEQYLHYLDPFVSSDLCAREMRVVVDPVDSAGERVDVLNPSVTKVIFYHLIILSSYFSSFIHLICMIFLVSVSL